MASEDGAVKFLYEQRPEESKGADQRVTEGESVTSGRKARA